MRTYWNIRPSGTRYAQLLNWHLFVVPDNAGASWRWSVRLRRRGLIVESYGGVRLQRRVARRARRWVAGRSERQENRTSEDRVITEPPPADSSWPGANLGHFGTGPGNGEDGQMHKNPTGLLTEREACKFLKVSRDFLARRRMKVLPANASPGPPYIRMGRSIKYCLADLRAWIAANRHE